MKELVRKGTECFFGVLQGHLKILFHELHEWSDKLIIQICKVCLIQNVMIDVKMCRERKDEILKKR